MQPLKGLLHLPGPRQIVEAVQAADGRVHRAVQVQRLHEELRAWLLEAGFTHIRTYGDCRMSAPREGENRITVDVEDQQAAGGDEEMQPLEGLLHLPGARQIVEGREAEVK